MNGSVDRGPDSTDLKREVGDAAAGICYNYVYEGEPFTTCTKVRRNGNNTKVVLSPIVIDHYPKHLGSFVPGEDGYVVFDCEMDLEHVAAANVIGMTGTSAELTNVGWESPYAIKFTLPEGIPGEDEYCLLGFQVDPDSARSRHNKSKLDGNNYPNTM